VVQWSVPSSRHLRHKHGVLGLNNIVIAIPFPDAPEWLL
jgi:hypothetical protein